MVRYSFKYKVEIVGEGLVMIILDISQNLLLNTLCLKLQFPLWVSMFLEGFTKVIPLLKALIIVDSEDIVYNQDFFDGDKF